VFDNCLVKLHARPTVFPPTDQPLAVADELAYDALHGTALKSNPTHDVLLAHAILKLGHDESTLVGTRHNARALHPL
jgi:hypothetical protein